MKKIFIDVDDVICDNGFMYLVNSYLGTNHTLDEVKSYYVEEDLMTPEQIPGFYDYIADKNTYDHSFIFEGAYEGLKALNEKYEVYICSSCAIDIPGLKEASGMYFKNKYDFLIKNFPFLDINKFIFTGSKNVFRCDVQIDDRLSHLKGDVETKLLFEAYHNKEYDDEFLESRGIKRVKSWKDITDILL